MRYVLTRSAVALGTLGFVLVFNFFLFRIAADPEALIRQPRMSEASRKALFHERGLDRDIGTQFLIYVRNTLSGELEVSFTTHRPVSEEIFTALPNTLLLVGAATILSALFGTWLAIAAATRASSRTDRALTGGSLILYSIPEFWLGTMFIWLFASTLDVLPTGLKSESGAQLGTLGYSLDVVRHAVLPVVTLTLVLLGEYVLIMRSALLTALGQDFAMTARAIGLPRSLVVRRHALRNALLPAIALLALNLGFVVTGSITIEALFSWPGVGELTAQAIGNEDIPLLQGIFLVASAAVIFMNLIADLISGYLDPRIRTV